MATVVLVLALTGVFILSLGPITDVDLWGHLAVGREIIRSHSVPTIELFSHTAAGRPWIAQEWLSGVVFSLLHSVAGLWGIALLRAGLAAGIVGAMTAAARVRGAPPFVALLAALAVFSSRPDLQIERTYLFSDLTLLITLALLGAARAGSLRWLYCLPPLLFVSANLHPGVVLALGAVGIEVVVAWWRGDPRARSLGWTVAACTGAVLLTPHHFWTLLLPFISDPWREAYVLEWQRPELASNILLLCLVVAVLVAEWLGGLRSPRLADLALLLVFSGPALFVARYQKYALLAGGMILASGLALRSGPRVARWGLGALLVVICGLSPWVSELAAGLGSPAARTAYFFIKEPDPRRHPVRAAEYLGRLGRPGRLFHIYEDGGYLMWALPESTIFVDGRATPYDAEIHRDYLLASEGRPGWREVLDRHRVEIVVFPTRYVGGRLAGLLLTDPGWRAVYEDQRDLVFVRRGAGGS